jgi:hypothetical protein
MTDLSNKPIEKAEYWHSNLDGDGMAGPFDTIEDCKNDALHSERYRIPEVRIVKTIAVSETKVSYATVWNDKWL